MDVKDMPNGSGWIVNRGVGIAQISVIKRVVPIPPEGQPHTLRKFEVPLEP
jgi:hypothetical protein